ncbi:MAG: engB [Parachlamydiales bacterium]|nr:engB [Parachlamydiales bacterium]
MKSSMRYIASALEPASWPRCLTPQGAPLPEIALAGRSNVGKSTLINLLGGQKKLAKISSTPGKTQRMQFFCYEERCLLVDLPGYGFAIAPASVRAEWSEAIDQYFNTRASLKLLLLLLDIRRTPTPDDLELVRFAREKSIPLLPVLTKTDMLSPSECEQQRNQIIERISPGQPIDVLTAPDSRRRLWSILARYL